MKFLPLCVACLAGVLITAATTKVWLHDKEVIDRSFLAQLRNIPIEHGINDDEVYGRPIWENAEALHYLARTGDPDAVRVVVRLMARGGAPGGCSCTQREFHKDIILDGVAPEFWQELLTLTVSQQIDVLEAVDACGGYTDHVPASDWDTDRDTFLATQPETQAQYAARHPVSATADENTDDPAPEANQP